MSKYDPESPNQVIRFISGLEPLEWEKLRAVISSLPEITARSTEKFVLPSWIKNPSEAYVCPDPKSFIVATDYALPNSDLWTNSDADLIFDVLSLTTVAKGFLVNMGCWIKREGKYHSPHTSVYQTKWGSGGIFNLRRGTGAEVVSKLIASVKSRKVDSVSFEAWLIAFRWHYHAARSGIFSPGNLTMATRWIALEILGKSFNMKHMGNTSKKKQRVLNLLEARGWDVSSGSWLENRVDYWYESRNATVHEGISHPDKAILPERFHDINRLVSALLMDLCGAVHNMPDLRSRIEKNKPEPLKQ